MPDNLLHVVNMADNVKCRMSARLECALLKNEVGQLFFNHHQYLPEATMLTHRQLLRDLFHRVHPIRSNDQYHNLNNLN